MSNDFVAPDAPVRVTFSANAKPNAPTVTVTARTEALLELKLQALENNGTLATVARVANAFAAQFNVGDILGAQVEVAELQSAPPAVIVNNPATVIEQLSAPSPVTDAPAFAYDPATDAAAFALNQQRQAPAAELPGQTAAFAPDVAPSPFATGGVIPGQAPSQYVAPQAPQPQGGLPGQTGVDPTGRPVGPFLPGLNANAVFVTGTGRSGEWRAWADPRGQQVTQSIPTMTAVPNDPAIAAGQARFWDWVR